MAEIVPVQKRGLVLALSAGMMILFTPSFLYSQLITAHTTWRWVFYICVYAPSIIRLSMLRPNFR